MSLKRNMLTFIFVSVLILSFKAKESFLKNDNLIKNNTTSYSKLQSMNSSSISSINISGRTNSSDTNNTNWKNLKDKQIEIKKALDSLITEVDKVANEMNITNADKEEINIKIGNLKESFHTLSKKIIFYDKKNIYRLDKISHSVIEGVISQFMISLLDLRKKINNLMEKISEDEIKIMHLKESLPDPNTVCAELNSCSSCVANPGCGWCASSNICVEGNNQGPKQGKDTCPSYNFKKCPEKTNCSSYTQCSDCIKDVACGWCSNINLNLHICMTKNEGETGLCNANFFHHIWKNDITLSKCPKVNINNFVKYIKNNLHDSNDFAFINKPSGSNIKLPDKNNIKTTHTQLEKTLNNKIRDQINVDRLMRSYNETKSSILDLDTEINNLDQQTNLRNNK